MDAYFAAVKIDATLYDDQTEAGTWTLTDVPSAIEGAKEPFLVGFRNTDAMVTNSANNVCFGAADFELHRLSGVRIFHRVVEQIRENVAQQTSVGLYQSRHFGKEQFDGTLPVSGRMDFVDDLSGKCPELEKGGLEFHLSGFEAADYQRFLHQISHPADVFPDRLQMVFPFGRL